MTDWNPDNPFDLGVWDELGCSPPPCPVVGNLSPLKLPIPSDPPPTKKRKLSLQLKKACSGAEASSAPTSSRFVSPKKDLESYQKGYIPKNNSINTFWVTRNFKDWVVAYNSHHPESPCPEDILLTDNAKDISFWLQKFIMGTRKKNGEKYPPKTLYFILCGLNRYIKEQKEVTLINIFNKNDPNFNQLCKTCDALFQELRAEGVGAAIETTEPLTREDEEKLWESGQLDTSTPRGIITQCSVIFSMVRTLPYEVGQIIGIYDCLKS